MSVLQQLTDEQLMALKNKDYSGFTDEQLIAIKNEKNKPTPIPQEPTFAEGVQDIVHGAIAGVAQGALDDKEFARLSSERSPLKYAGAKLLGEAAPMALLPGGIVAGALGVGTQAGVQSVIRGESTEQVAENALEGAALGAGVGLSGRLLGGAGEAASEISNWSKDSLSKAYNISKKLGTPLASKETGLALRGQILSKFDDLKNFVNNQKKSTIELQKIRLNELAQVADSNVNNEIRKLVVNTRDKLNQVSPSLLSKFAEESAGASKFLTDIEKGVSTTEPYSLEKLNNLKRDLQDHFDFSNIKSPIIGKLGLKVPKQYDFSRIEKVMKGFEQGTRDLLYTLEKKIPSSTGRTLEDINQEYHNLSKIEKKMPKITEFASNENPAVLNNSLQNTIQFHDKLMQMYPDKAPEMLKQQNELLALRDVYSAAEGVAGAPISVNRIANVSAYPSALRGAGYLGRMAGEYPLAEKGAQLGIYGTKKMVPAVIKTGASRITKDAKMGLMVSEQERSPDSVMNEMTMNNVLQEAQQGEITTGAKLPRNFAAARRNQAPIAQALGAIDPETAVRFSNAITNNDARAVENMMGSFATDPRYNGIFTPTPIISSKGAINSAVQSGDRIRIVDPIEQAIVRKDFLNDDALSNTEKAERINQLNKDNSISMPKY